MMLSGEFGITGTLPGILIALQLCCDVWDKTLSTQGPLTSFSRFITTSHGLYKWMETGHMITGVCVCAEVEMVDVFDIRCKCLSFVSRPLTPGGRFDLELGLFRHTY